MRVAFHDNGLSIRGTSVAVYDYAFHAQRLWGYESVILHDRNNKHNSDLGMRKFAKDFLVLGYDDFTQVDGLLSKYEVDLLYMIKSGRNDGKYSKRVKTVIHSVFQNYEPHGDVYAYVSKWLSEKLSQGKSDFVNHIVDLPDPKTSIRGIFDIPDESVVIGRYGGLNEFNIDFVKTFIKKYVEYRSDVYFLFVNTQRFIDHERVLFLPPIVDMQEKSNFINSCDAMIHARSMGESFGLSICEFLYFNKPVISYRGGIDQNHIAIMGNDGLWYQSEDDLWSIFNQFQRPHDDRYKRLVSEFTPENVMSKFKKVFIDG